MNFMFRIRFLMIRDIINKIIHRVLKNYDEGFYKKYMFEIVMLIFI